MNTVGRVSRRRVLEMSAAAGGLALLGNAGALLAKTPMPGRTPAQILGPFYPVLKPLDQDADLTVVRGRTGRALGLPLHVTGRVLNMKGKPVDGARIEIWQANAAGRYTHPSDRNQAPLDPNFEGYALLKTDAEVRYRFKTIKPGAYPGDSGTMRPPHIHFDVAGKINRIVTQMYFAGEPLNDTDRFLQTAGANRGRLLVALEPPARDLEPESRLIRWDIVLDEG